MPMTVILVPEGVRVVFGRTAGIVQDHLQCCFECVGTQLCRFQCLILSVPQSPVDGTDRDAETLGQTFP
ncbi:MAG: hypothetical protein BGO89_06735 [Candidatus Kapaibacterium thiocyanatum]|uniref:Uncharacterized protein n=1 Tax=Candidatus Kapaibacterium thiocyanatum TaxID=1895771 RepID=A0A1M3KYU2_9BACT|nr:MAG: hypothetical protein BGO89_06735 ['Candidatus Kapabacteria' thiocyanatum]